MNCLARAIAESQQRLKEATWAHVIDGAISREEWYGIFDEEQEVQHTIWKKASS